jgi:hypothetical protein
MPDPHRIERELQDLLSRPNFSSIFYHRNEFKKPINPAETPESVAKRTAQHLFKNNPLMDPVEVLELRGPIQLYRAHDGGATLTSARTLGGSWIERPVAEALWNATAKYQGDQRKKMFMEFMRTSNFVLPEWNAMLYIVCMSVPAGHSVVVARGRGSWKAMRTNPSYPRPGGATSINNSGDVMDHLGMMPSPGVVQCVVPLFNDNWIQPVTYPSAKWPFLT